MIRPRLVALAALLLAFQARTALAQSAADLSTDMRRCADAAARTEQASNLPAGILLAIGRMESGRWDPVTEQTLPWPFAVNAAGEGHLFPTMAEAQTFVTERQATGVRSIDIGCFQINLKHHPAAFATLQQGFDPDANAKYAASFLTALHEQTGSWEAAIGRYHSATPEAGEPYRDAVLALWKGGGSVRQMVGAARTVTVSMAAVQLVAGVIVQRPGMQSGAPYPRFLAANLPRVITR